MVKTTTKKIFIFSLVLSLTLTMPAETFAIPGISATENAPEDSTIVAPELSFEELIAEAKILLNSGRPIDARAKLQRAVQMRPDDYRPYMYLGQYYLIDVAQFKMAYRYIKTAENRFSTQHGSDLLGNLDDNYSGQHAMLLYLRSEAELNLDKYQNSLDTLNRFEALYWLDWFPGTKAWVLMKLNRVDEAIEIAQQGLVKNADPRRTWNILGILLSIKGKRRLSLQAFREAIKTELSTYGGGVATPLNNAGEVYRELFEDQFAEGSWLKAVQLPDGCEHVLPSLNLAHLYIDQLRLFQAERTLTDFQRCFEQQTFRKDSEHRSLLALARGKVKLHQNRVDEALELLELAAQEQQWFGKIGTNENDMKFAAFVTLAQALVAKAEALEDRSGTSLLDSLSASAQAPALRFRAWWLNRKARRLAIEELKNFEDLFVRNTDAMVQYPTMGSVFSDFETLSVRKRMERMIASDPREPAHDYYKLYLADNLLHNGKEQESAMILSEVRKNLRPIDRLAKAEATAKLILANRGAKPWWRGMNDSEEALDVELREELYALLPSHIRYHGLSLPTSLSYSSASPGAKSILESLADKLAVSRFDVGKSSAGRKPRYMLTLSNAGRNEETNSWKITAQLKDRKLQNRQVIFSKEINDTNRDIAEFTNDFIAEAFAHQVDAPGYPIPQLPILKGIFQ